MKEVEKAKKEAAKFKTKRDKEKEKEREEKQNEDTIPDESTTNLPQRHSTPYSYKPPPPPPPYTLHSAPSVSQLVYQPPSLERMNSVRNSSNAVTTLALSLEPTTPTCTNGMPTPPTSPPDNGPNGANRPYAAYTPQPPLPSQEKLWVPSEPSSKYSQDDNQGGYRQNTTRPSQPGKRVFSDPGPGQANPASSEHLRPGSVPIERSRSPYGFSRVPEDEVPTVNRKRPSFQTPPPTNHTGNTANHRTFSTPAYESTKMGSVPEEPEPAASAFHNSTSPAAEPRKSSFTYYPPPPPPIYTDDGTSHAQHTNVPPHVTPTPKATSNIPREPSVPPPPSPRHGTIYIALTPYLTHEIDHLSLVPFDTLVDVTSYTPEESDLPYPTAFDVQPKHYWQASLGNRRGPRGLFPCDVVCPIDDARVTQKLSESWFADHQEVGFIADGMGRCWVGAAWEWKEPVRRRSKWWAEEF
jgi:hypothetical protein